MPRTARASCGGICYHVLNRGNAKARVFHDPADYEAFLSLAHACREIVPMDLFAYCLMPNHFHLVVRPHHDGDLGVWMHRLMTAQVKRHGRRYGTVGRIWQGRFKSFPIQTDRHLLTVLRYVERNPVEAGLVDPAERWPWSSLAMRNREDRTSALTPSPVSLGTGWASFVNQRMTADELNRVEECIRRERPLGDAWWVRRTAQELGLESSLRPIGRPRKIRDGTAPEKDECPGFL